MRLAQALALASLACASAAPLACGGGDGDGLSRGETRARAGAICRAATERARQAAGGRGAPSSPDEVNGAVEADLGIARGVERELRRLDPVAGGRASFDRFVGAQHRIVSANAEQLAASRARDPRRFRTSVQHLLAATGDAKKAAAAYGLAGCPYLPVAVQLLRAGAAPRSTGVVGRWSGRVTQYGPGHKTERYGATMTITASTPGAVAGTIDYPDIPCGGELRLRGSEGGRYVYRERITSGRSRCYDGGTILAAVSGDSLSWRWVAPGSEVLGVLRRAG